MPVDSSRTEIAYGSSTTLLQRSMPLYLEYDLSRMVSQVRVTFPRHLGGVSAHLALPGIGGALKLRIEEADESGLQAVLMGLDVTLGRVALPLGRDHEATSIFNLVKLQLAEDRPHPVARVDHKTGQMGTLEAVIEAKSPNLLAAAVGGSRLALSLTEKLNLSDLSLHGSGVGAIESGLLKGGIFTFSHSKPPPTPPPTPTPTPTPPPPPPPAAPTTYCVYTVIRGFQGLTPPLGVGDVLCANCPPSGTCPGSDASDFEARVTDAAGRISTGSLRRVGGRSCGGCPDDGKTGYTIVL
jgi:hypothetical protein